MRTAVFTLTRRYGGLDVTASRLQGHDITWIVGDMLDRRQTMLRRASDIEHLVFDAPKACAGYNQALNLARKMDVDLLLLLCDYTWIPPDGIGRFQQLTDQYPGSLLTGLCSHSTDPPRSEIANPRGLWTIFGTPYDGHKPEHIGWEDVREGEALRRYGHKGPHYRDVDCEWWEANWAAIPKAILDDHRLVFDEAYDRGLGNENTRFAMDARNLGYNIVLDTGNHAIELPHREYFPQEWEELTKVREEQERWHQDRCREQFGAVFL